MPNLSKIEGIGTSYAAKLNEAGIKTTEELLDQSATPKGCSDLAEKTGISSKLILTWVNHKRTWFVKPHHLAKVQDWVGQAKALSRKVNY
jgi:hypothetical protein